MKTHGWFKKEYESVKDTLEFKLADLETECEESLKKAITEIHDMTEEEFDAFIEEHQDGDIAKGLFEIGYLNNIKGE